MAPALFQESTVSLHDRWHSGERKVQDLLHVREAVEDHSSIFRPYLTTQMQEFIPSLNYFFIGTLDEHGRPWVSIVTGPKGFMRSSNGKILEIKTRMETHGRSGHNGSDNIRLPDPIFHNLTRGETFRDGKRMFGGVALDFSNRRRNKMNGVLYPQGLVAASEESGELHIQLTVEQTIGNCPKYITIRELRPVPSRQDDAATRNVSSTRSREELETSHELGEEEQAVIRQADCLFISSRFIDETLADQTSGMDCNHRGGNPGFVRILDGNRLVFPDYSGNRFFNTLGNIANDDRVGLLFIAFESGDLLHVTGHAEIFVGQESQTLYPHTQRCVQITLDSDHRLRKGALPFRMYTKELSPYNPILPSNQHHSTGNDDHPTNGRTTATLSKVTKHTHDISTFHFNTSQPIQYSPGQYAVLDFSQFDTVGYRHMAPDNPQSLNDDYIRTWTISSAPTFTPSQSRKDGEWKESSEFTMTIKRKSGGAISNLLHDLVLDPHRPFAVPLVSTGGDFVLPPLPTIDQPAVKMVFLSGGIGSTPFISMLRGVKQLGIQGTSVDIQWINSTPYFEDALPDVLNELTTGLTEPSLKLSLNVFLTRESIAPVLVEKLMYNNIRIHLQRLDAQALLASVPDLQEDERRQILLCGPEPFMESMKGYLQELGINPGRIQTENFNF